MKLNMWASTLLLMGFFALAACENVIAPMDDPDTPEPGQSNRDYDQPEGTILGGDGLDLLGLFGSGTNRGSGGGGGGGIGVNSYLWRASLDTISFMPLVSADPFGGVIITDWFTPLETPDERFKITVYILDRQLRADGIRVALFRQNRGNGQWANAKIGKKTVTKLENQILTRARQLRLSVKTDLN